ncbi:DUF4190 domain-containing protein [Luteolibacter luteus]|uniref:DUF4190 domain-containing protein n=1 Tax=Luteolibacter luteus TaxID=2728835 RepID=A0A858RJJ6_9BACT|nr:DUF4190 domain-containing protein [Luteolibacter luteus]QJE96751.1 DUF4190 domain-containing protein [Luteolibacter luteus]
MDYGKNQPGALSIAAFSLSCLGALSFGLLAIPGVICGHLARRRSLRDHAFAGAALIIGYCILGLFFGLPLLALGGMLQLSIPLTGNFSRELPADFSGLDPVVRTVEAQPAASGALGKLVEHYGSLLIVALLGLVVIVFAAWAAPRFGRWFQHRQLRRLMAINRSR